MTGKTHDQICMAGALGASVALQLSIETTAMVTLSALAFARAPDYLEPVVLPVAKRLARRAPARKLGHRTVTHYLPSALAVGVLCAVAALLALPSEYEALGVAWAAGGTLGCWLHSLADACTDMGCWLWRRERQAILPKRMRIHVYRIETRKHWLTGKVTTTKRPSRGERAYYRLAQAMVLVFGAIQGVLLAHDQFNPPV